MRLRVAARLRALSLVAALGFAGLSPALLTPVTACASTEVRAALVIDTGARATTYCVALGGGAVSGMQLIQLAGRQYGLDYRLGFGGKAVCRLDGVGTSGADCFGAAPDFWGYWRGNGSGGWSWSSTGAADTTVHAGDIEGWSWGRGQDGSSHPEPARGTFTSVCPEPSPDPSDGPPPHGGGGTGDSGNGRGSGSGTEVGSGPWDGAGAGAAPPGSGEGNDAGRPTHGGDGGGAAAAETTPPAGDEPTAPTSETSSGSPPSPATIVAASPLSSLAGSGGLPVPAILSLAAAMALGAGGLIYARRGAGRR